MIQAYVPNYTLEFPANVPTFTTDYQEFLVIRHILGNHGRLIIWMSSDYGLYLYLQSVRTRTIWDISLCIPDTCCQLIRSSMMKLERDHSFFDWATMIAVNELRRVMINWIFTECLNPSLPCIRSNGWGRTLRRIGRFKLDLQADHLGRWQNCIYSSLCTFFSMPSLDSCAARRVCSYCACSIIYVLLKYSFIVLRSV
jgi:hypothetical protein